MSGMHRKFSRVSVTIVGLVFAGCSEPSDVEPDRGVAVAVIAAEPAPPPGAGAVTITNVRLVLGGLKLETAGQDATVDWVFDESRVIEVDLAGDPVTAYALLNAPHGIYKEIEISIHKLEVGKPAEATLLAEHPDLADASIVITGQVLDNGSEVPFALTAALDRDIEILLQPVLVLADDGEPTGIRVTLFLDLEGWFRGSSGQWLDPRNPANRSAIESNVQASLEAFEDGNLDGVPGPVGR
jgi:hypothetical protein